MGISGGRRAAALAAVFVTLMVLVVAACGTARPAPRLSRPVVGAPIATYDDDLGDPFLLVVGSGGPARYVLFGTDDPPDRVPTAVSGDLRHWRRGPDAFPDLPTWAVPDPGDGNTWAPAVLATAHGYVLYVSVVDATSGRHCIAAAASGSPTGPYRDALGHPLVCQRTLGGSIDPAVVTGPGAPTLLWRSAGTTALYSQRLRPDGLGLTGGPHLLLRPDEAWQGGVVEEPAVLPASRGGWWLFYSGNAFNRAAYATGVAYCPTLDGPCREAGSGPILPATGGQLSNPASLETFRAADGRFDVVYDTWSRPARGGVFYCCRAVTIAPVLAR